MRPETIIPTIDEALADRNLLGAALGDLSSWATWRVILKAAFALPLDDGERAIFHEISGGREPPTRRVHELWAAAGRRGGKSRMCGAIAAYAGAFNTYRLAAGETATVLALALNRDQAKVALDYAGGFLNASPILRQLLDGEPTAEEIRLKGNVIIKAGVASFRGVRSASLILAIFDECAFWRDSETSKNPDDEIYTATLPSLAASGGMLIGISSLYRRSGLLFQKHQASYGKNDPDVLVIVAPSLRLNPTLDPSAIDRARSMDPVKARSEWDAEFRNDISDFLSREAILDCVDEGVRERPPDRQWHYVGFVDPSGGGADSFTLGIAHREGETAVLDLLREIRPGNGAFNPEAIVSEFAGVLKGYRISTVTGDRFAGDWPAAAFRKHGINYQAANKPKSDLYRDLLPAINSGAVALLEHERMTAQLSTLERRTGRGGKDSIDHPPGGHDDVANVAAGCLVMATARPSYQFDPEDIEPIPEPDPLDGF